MVGWLWLVVMWLLECCGEERKCWLSVAGKYLELRGTFIIMHVIDPCT